VPHCLHGQSSSRHESANSHCILSKSCKFQRSCYLVCYRTIDKYGGLDAYLLGTTDEKLASDVGSELKQQIRAALALQKQQRKNGVQSATVGPHRGLCYVVYIAFPEEHHLSERNLKDMGNATKNCSRCLGSRSCWNKCNVSTYRHHLRLAGWKLPQGMCNWTRAQIAVQQSKVQTLTVTVQQ
jgi:hypothetical protein